MAFLWHDYETYGTNPAVDRPCQFAAQRTDDELRPIGDPVEIYCSPASDVLPHPGACLITGITPQLALEKGVTEVEFARQINAAMSEAGTCAAGYNSLKFDDEVSRHLFYRNLMDPYEREWKNGNSRWDLINLARMCYALRPEGINWPMVTTDASGNATTNPDEAPLRRPSFRLEDLARANDIEHQDAHDALSDVRATIALARLLRESQPRLFEWSLRLRNKQEAKKLLDTESLTPVVHSSGRIPAARGSTSLVLPLMPHPINDKAVIVFDLMGDARALTQCDADAVRDRVFTPVADMPEDVERLPLKVIKWNAVPMLAPSGVLNGVDLQRIGLDLSRCEENAELLKRHIHTVRRAVAEAFQATPPDEGRDPELALYGGGFFDDADRRLMQAIHRTSPEELSKKAWDFHDARLPLMLLRFRARNWPDTLSQSEWEAWNQDRATRLLAPEGSPFYGQDAFKSDLLLARESHRGDPKARHILDALEAWSRDLDLKAHISNL